MEDFFGELISELLDGAVDVIDTGSTSSGLPDRKSVV